MLPGEIPVTETVTCCGDPLPLEVLRSAAGHYIGRFCPGCGPYSRESDYYPTYEKACAALASNTFFRA